MSIQFSFGNGLLRAAVSLGFLGCLLAQGTLSSQAASAEPSFCASRFANLNNAAVPARSAVLARSTYQGDALRFHCSDFMLTEQMEIVLSDDDVALEDSIEIFRVDIQQRTFGIDRVVNGPKVASKAARKTRPNISPPLLV